MTGQEEECVAFALEGESRCRSGDFHGGIESFLQALHIGTSDVAVMSAIFIQLGNAYFYLENYDLALEYHKRDIKIARDIHDERGEAKASGNIATTLKCLSQFDEAIVAGQRQLDIYRKLNDDKMAIARALYNLGNIYLAKGKSGIGCTMIDGEELAQETKENLMMAAAYYKENYEIVKESRDLPAQGRVCGNLGSVEYMMGNFPVAVMFHQERLLLARECKDLPAERRAYTNLGNCHVFLGQYPVAEQYYLKALALVDRVHDRALEAQACYSLGNTYSLMDRHSDAIQYYQCHLAIAKELADAVGQSRAYWSLGSAYAACGNVTEAIRCAEKHLRISQELGDPVGCSFAETSLQEYAKTSEGMLGAPEDVSARIRRISMEQMDLLRLSPDAKSTQKKPLQSLPEETRRAPSPVASSSRAPVELAAPNSRDPISPVNESEDFFDMLSRVQSKRYDDQRATFSNKENNHQVQVANGSCHQRNNHHQHGNGHSTTGIANGQVRTFEELMDMIAGVQSKRLDEQRADLPPSEPEPTTNGRRLSERKSESTEDDSFPDEQFFDMLAKVQGSRMVDQRATLSSAHLNKAPTVPDEDFSTLVIARRLGSISGASASSNNSKK